MKSLHCLGLVLLLACVNLVNLLFARLVSRQRELAIRAAMGASKLRLARLFTAETLPLAFLGLSLLARARRARWMARRAPYFRSSTGVSRRS